MFNNTNNSNSNSNSNNTTNIQMPMDVKSWTENNVKREKETKKKIEEEGWVSGIKINLPKLIWVVLYVPTFSIHSISIVEFHLIRIQYSKVRMFYMASQLCYSIVLLLLVSDAWKDENNQSHWLHWDIVVYVVSQ